MTISAPSCERMMSSIPCRSSVPGARRAIDASRRGSRRGSSPDGDRVNPRIPCLSPLSGIQARLNRLSQRLLLLHVEFATNRGSGGDDDIDQAELRALLEPPLSLCRRSQAPGQADLAEGGEAVADRGPFR